MCVFLETDLQWGIGITGCRKMLAVGLIESL